jgi:predicted nucleic acid-binding protein
VSYLVDTNVLAEPMKRKPDAPVVKWLRDHESSLYISTITIGEIRRGVERLPHGSRSVLLMRWLEILCERMAGRILSFNTSTAHVWGQLKAKWEKEGISVPSLDSQIAATAHRHQLSVVTRNAADFERTGIKVLNPFQD